MRIDAVFVLSIGAISYLKIMLNLYDNTFVALAIFLLSGGAGIFLGLSGSSAGEETHKDRPG